MYIDGYQKIPPSIFESSACASRNFIGFNAPLSLIVIGPIGYNIGIYLGQFFKWLFESRSFG